MSGASDDEARCRSWPGSRFESNCGIKFVDKQPDARSGSGWKLHARLATELGDGKTGRFLPDFFRRYTKRQSVSELRVQQTIERRTNSTLHGNEPKKNEIVFKQETIFHNFPK